MQLLMLAKGRGEREFRPLVSGFWTVGVVAALAVSGKCAGAAPVSTVFQINETTSSMTVEIEARGYTDSDEQFLDGTINATFDFGQAGSFPSQAAVAVASARVAATDDFEFHLGPFFFGSDVVASGIVADVTTPAPPATLTRLGGSPVTYQFDASQFLVTANEGTIVVTGFVDGSADLSQDPVSGTSPVGTLGTLSLTTGATSGFFTLVNASMTLPIRISDVAEFGEEDPEQVLLDIDAHIHATARFYVALSGVPGDFDGDGSVDGDDLTRWRAGFGKTTGAVIGDGNADGDQDVDGNDFLIWQRNLGTAPPPIPGATAPEPESASTALGALAALAAATRWRTKRNN